MTRYTVDGVAMARYLVDKLPTDSDKIFSRAENGVDVVEAPAVTVSETIWTAVNKSKIAGVEVDTRAKPVLYGLVDNGPVQVVSTDKRNLEICGSLIDHHTLHDALLVANHRVRETEAIVTADEAFVGEDTIW